MIEARQEHGCPTNSKQVRSAVPSPRNGFTLIELLITVALMIVIATLYYGFGSRNHQQRQKRLCQQNFQKLYLALQIYAADHKGRFPEVLDAVHSANALDLLVPRYTVDTSLFICPGSKDSSLPPGESIRNREISYAYYMGWRSTDPSAVLASDRQINTQPKNPGDPVFSSDGEPPGNNHYRFGGNFLFSDGRVETSGSTTRIALAFPPHVRLLNPTPER